MSHLLGERSSPLRRRGSRVCGTRGSVTVLSAASLMVTCVLCLASVDLLQVLRAKAHAQMAADAAALAAARELAIPSSRTPYDAALQYAELNGAVLKSCVCAPGSGEAVVAVEMPVRLAFLSPTRPVVARARAVVEGSGPAGRVPKAKSEAASTMPP